MAHAKSIYLTNDEICYLQSLTRRRTIQAQVVERAKILIYKSEGLSCQEIARRLDIHICKVKLCLLKFNEGGMEHALFDEPRKGRPIEITEEAAAWIVKIACKPPREFGFSRELWTLQLLHQYIQQNAQAAGYPRLSTVTKPMVGKILQRENQKSLKMIRRGRKEKNDFDIEMHEVLIVFETIETCSGALFILAGIDLLTGRIIPVISETYGSTDFIHILEQLDEEYPEKSRIRIICNEHESRYKEVPHYLAIKPEKRFIFASAPGYGVWLNLVESLFKKMVKQMLSGIRFHTNQELAERICQYFEETNRSPTIYHWTYRLDDISDKEIDLNMVV